MDAPNEHPALLTHDHPRRRAILELLLRRPALQINEIAEELQLPWMMADYHVRVLLKLQALQAVRVGGRLHYFAQQGEAGAQMRRAALLKRAVVGRLVEFLRYRPEADQSEIARSISASQGNVSRTLRLLVDSNVVRMVRHAGRKRYVLRP